MTGTPTLAMLWEPTDPAEALTTRFGHRDADEAARWVTDALRTQWGLVVEHCDRIVLSGLNAMAWIGTPSERLLLKWSVAPDRFSRLASLADLTNWLAERELPVSRPLPALDGRLQLPLDGASLGLQREIPGRHLATDQRTQVREAGRVLARLHDALAAYPDRIPDLAHPTGSLSGRIDDWFDARPDHLPPEALAELRRLSAAATPDPLPTQLVHGDYRAANLLLDGPRIVAVLDFEEARIDHPVVELARSAVLLGTLFHDWGPVSADVHANLLDGYQSHRPLSPAEESWWRPLLLWITLSMVPVTGDPAGWTASALDQCGLAPGPTP